MKSTFILVSLGILSGGLSLQSAEAQQDAKFHPPFRVMAQDMPIDVEVGHAAPLVTDFDGDNVDDLLVGQFGGGKLRIYRNIGTPESPEFGGFAWFKASGKVGDVPAG